MALPAILGAIGRASAIGGRLSRVLGSKAMVRRLAVTAVRLDWLGERVEKNINMGMDARVRLAAQLLRDRVVVNISRPVTKLGGGRVDPGSRSKPGEFPKADTTRLMKDIFWESRGEREAIVGTTLDYGAVLELGRLKRSFLQRTLREEQGRIRRILLNGKRLPGQE